MSEIILLNYPYYYTIKQCYYTITTVIWDKIGWEKKQCFLKNLKHLKYHFF